MGPLFESVDNIARHILLGFVALAIAWAIGDLGDDRCVLKQMYESTGSWWPILLLAPFIGCLVYAVHTSIYFPVWGTWLFRFALQRERGKHDEPEKIKVKKDLFDQQRWVRRVSERPEIRAAQTRIDAWAAQIHLLYCSAWAMGLTTIVVAATPEFDFHYWSLWPVSVAFLLWILAAWNDYRAMRYALRVQKDLQGSI